MNEKNNNSASLAVAVDHKLTRLIDYADGSIVSRTIMKAKSGNVTLFALDAGQSISEHTSPFDAMVQVYDGEVRLVIGGETVTTKTGEIVIMPADIPHALYADKPFKMLLTMLRG